MDTKAINKKIREAIYSANTVLLISHQNPDGDALGCLTAFSQYLDNIKKNHEVFCMKLPKNSYRFLLNIEKVKSFDHELSRNFDLIITFDSSSLQYAGAHKLVESLKGNHTLINIDHHHTNELFGHINLVKPSAASTTEIVHRYFLDLEIRLSKNIAISLMTGILGDTDSFSNHNTTPNTLHCAASLLSAGAPIEKIVKETYRNKSVQILKHWGKAFERLTVNEKFKIGYTVLTEDELKSFENEQEATEGLANYLNNLSGVNLILVLKEIGDGTIKGSFRTGNDDIDVSALAKLFGGGGHKKAAGFTLKGKLVKIDTGWKIV